ncbi:hypothetical protein GCM10027446_14480 [Angustibacter peucedani]
MTSDGPVPDPAAAAVHPSPYASPHRPAVAPPPLFPALQRFWAAQREPAPARTVWVCAAVGVVAAVLLVGRRPAAAGAVVGLLLWSAAVPVLLRRRAFGDLATVALSVALVGVLALRDAGWVVGLCLAAAALTGAAAATSARSAPAVALGVWGWLAGCARAVPWLGRGVGASIGTRRDRVLGLLRSVAISAALLLVFGLLFASADTVFASFLPSPDVGLLPVRVVVGVLVAVACAASAHLALAGAPWSDVDLPAPRPARRVEWLLPVLSLDLMVLAFVGVQVSALLGGHRHVLEAHGLTYAQYTRHGFVQLVAATALTLVVVAVAARRAPRGGAHDRLVAQLALGALCVGTLGVVASALRRVDLYVEAFGLTRLRLLVVVSEVALGVVLLLVVAAGVRWRAGWLPRALVQVVGLAALALALVNPDAQVVRHNVAAQPLADLDLVYLQQLSADAVPAMAALDEPLRSCLLAGATTTGPHGFADWSWGRARAADAVRRQPVVEGLTPCAALGAARYVGP